MIRINTAEIKQRAQALNDQIIATRRYLHQHPELSCQEFETAAYLAARLRELGLEVQEGVGGTGVVGLLRGARPGRTVAVRADIDALPIQEANELPYKSIYPNRMHACGHDGHTAMVLGGASLLAPSRTDLAGNVKFIFQPAEETPPEGGARAMIEQGVLENPKVEVIFGIHIWPDVPAGKIGLMSGPIMAEADRFELTLRGKGGHGATPHHTVDSLVLTAQTILSLQTLVSRKVDPLKSVVVSICSCHGGSAYNILPDEMLLEGTTRYFEPEMGEFLEEQIAQIVGGICQAYGGSYALKYQYGFPPTVNDADITARVAGAAAEILGDDNVNWVQEPSMIGEDFSCFLQEVPGCYFWLGTGNPAKGIVHPLHSPRYQMDESILSQGTAILAKAIVESLEA